MSAARSGCRISGVSSARRPRPFDHLDLSLQTLDLLLFLRPSQGILIQAQGLLRLAGLAIRVGEVLGHGRIVARQLERPLQVLDRLRVLAALVVHPAQAVDVEAVVRIEGNGAADQIFRFVETHAHVGVGVPEVVERGGVLRVQFDRLLHLGDAGVLLL